MCRADVAKSLNLPAVRVLSTIERVLALKATHLFGALPDDTLAGLAAVLTEVELSAGEQLFARGDRATCLFLLVVGHMHIHDGPHTLSELGPGDSFGEMAVLDAEPRMASATALEPATLLQLDRDPLYALMAEYPAITRAIAGVLIGWLNDRLVQIADLDRQIAALTAAREPPA